MGTDKGLLRSAEGAWARTALHKLSSLRLPVVLSINTRQLDDYAPLFPSTELIVDDPSLPLAGPLLALLSVHLCLPSEDLLVLACDMPVIQSFQLQHLVDQYRQAPHFEAYVYTGDDAPEPLCGIYTAAGLSSLLDNHRNGALKKFSMKHALGRLKTFLIPIPDEHRPYFKNVNSPADLE